MTACCHHYMIVRQHAVNVSYGPVHARAASTEPAASPEALTELILRIFRTNGRLLLAGDQLVAPLGLTSARWQVLGSIAAAGRPQPVAGLARDLGVTRQAVQRIANELERDGVIAFRSNPQHKRAQLVVLTDEGRTLFERASALQSPWAAALAEGLTGLQVATACNALDVLLERLNNGQVADHSVEL